MSGNKTFISTSVDPLLLVPCAKMYQSQVKYILLAFTWKYISIFNK